MKKILNALFLTLLTVFTFSSCSDVPSPYDILGEGDVPELTGDGTKENPYDIASAKQKQDGSIAWVQGYIVGCLEDIFEDGKYAGSKANFVAPFNITSNVLIAENPDETNESNCFPVKIKNGSDLSKAINLKDHPENKGSVLLIQGELSDGFGKAALINTTAAVFKGQTIGEEQGGNEPGSATVTENQPYEVSFASDLAGFTVENKVSEGLKGDVWYYSSKYTAATASSYTGGTNVPAEGWFLSPVLDMTAISKATLTFEHSSYSAGKPEELMLKVREENATDWTDLVISNYSTSRDNHVTTTVDLALFAAKKAQIAFVYKNREGGTNNTWYIYNVKVAASEGGGETPSDDPFGLNTSNPKSTFEAAFEDITDSNQNYSLEGWINKAIQSSNVWQTGIYNIVDKYIKATPYKVTANETMEAWFITPAFTVSTANKFTFDCAGANWQADMTLKVFFLQKDANGVVTKDEVTVPQIPTSGTNFEWVRDINVDLSSYNGKVGFIGFQYAVVSKGVNKNLPTYQIDNVKYAGDGSGETPSVVEEVFFEIFGERQDGDKFTELLSVYKFFDNNTAFVSMDNKAEIRQTKALDPHLYLPGNKPDVVTLSGLELAGYTNIKLSYKICTGTGKGKTNIVKVKCGEDEVEVPAVDVSTTYTDISMSIPVTSTVQFISEADNTIGFRIDDIKITGEK